MSKQNIKSKIARYKRRIIVFSVLASSIILSILIISVENVINTVISVKKLQSIFRTAITELNDELDFKNGKFTITLQRENKFIDIESTIKENDTKSIKFTEDDPYKTKVFYAKATRYIKDVQNYEDILIMTSNFADITKTSFTMRLNVEGKYITRLNPKINGSLIFADEIIFLKEGDANGKKLFIKSKSGNFSASNFYLYKSSDFGHFFGGVMMQNEDYKITSKTLDAFMLKGEIANLSFKGNVVFNQKGVESTTVYGDNAHYNNSTSELVITGNVRTTSTKNSFSATGDSFYYNTITKIGYLKSNNANTKQVEIELEI
jgi:lipopolysaccharide export system protein LptA